VIESSSGAQSSDYLGGAPLLIAPLLFQMHRQNAQTVRRIGAMKVADYSQNDRAPVSECSEDRAHSQPQKEVECVIATKG
jgi:hypothetical protein